MTCYYRCITEIYMYIHMDQFWVHFSSFNKLNAVIKHLVYSHSLAVVKCVAMNHGMQIPLFLWMYTQNRDCWITGYFYFPIMALPTYIPSSTGPHILTDTYLFHHSYSNRCQVISPYPIAGLIAFPWCIVIMSIFQVPAYEEYVFFGK